MATTRMESGAMTISFTGQPARKTVPAELALHISSTARRERFQCGLSLGEAMTLLEQLKGAIKNFTST